jgi:hypothetical protein
MIRPATPELRETRVPSFVLPTYPPSSSRGRRPRVRIYLPTYVVRRPEAARPTYLPGAFA